MPLTIASSSGIEPPAASSKGQVYPAEITAVSDAGHQNHTLAAGPDQEHADIVGERVRDAGERHVHVTSGEIW